MSDLPEWAASLPEELHDAPHLKGAESAGQWLEKIKNDSSWRGQSIRVPGADADEAVINEFNTQLRDKVPSLMPTPIDDESAGVVYAQMGKPKEAKDYAIPEGVTLDNPEEYRQAAYSLDMTQKVFDRWIGMDTASRTDRDAAAIEALEQSYGVLRSEWGAAYDTNYTRIGDIVRGAPASVVDAYNNNTLPVDQVKWLYSLAELANESTEVSGQQGVGVLTPEQASLELEEFKPKFYAMKKHDPGYNAAAAKVERLIKLRMGVAA